MSVLFKKEPREPGARIAFQVAVHEACQSPAYFSRSCGVFVCAKCGMHEGLVRCFCGWSVSGRSGVTELLEMGEVIDDGY